MESRPRTDNDLARWTLLGMPCGRDGGPSALGGAADRAAVVVVRGGAEAQK